MPGADLEREKQQANEELAGVLNELVIGPIDERLVERLREGLFGLEGNIEDKLKKQFTAVAKTRDLEHKLAELREGLDQLSSEFRTKAGSLSRSLEAHSQSFQAHVLSNHSELQHLRVQMESAHEGLGQTTEQAFSQVSAQLRQHVAELQAQLVRNEQVFDERNERLQLAIGELSQSSSVIREYTSSFAVQLQQGMSGLDEQNGNTAANLLQVHALVQQLQAQAASQKQEMKRLQQSTHRAYWSNLIVGVLALCAITVVALQTPVISALLGD